MKSLKIFIVEDDIWYAELLEYHLSLNPDYTIEKFTSGKELLDNLHRKPDLITLDYSLPDTSGEKVLKRIKSFNPDLPVIIISGQEDVSTAVNLLKEGASDYIVKDDDAKDRLWNSIRLIRENLSLKEEVTSLREQVVTKYSYNNIIKGNSPAITKVFQLIEKAARTNITVSITGETGTGKELVAKAIHYASPKQKQSFVAVNVAAIPKDLIESELFGHEKGAFTGAHSRRIGKFEEAHKGTIFLDEIGDMDLNLQAKLLRVLQEKEVTRIGANKPVKIDARVLVATHKNLLEEVKEGNFRQDLYYRLLGLPISLPPLRERGNDIILLAKFFVDSFTADNQLPNLKLSSPVQKKLLKYGFPGNVRELKAVMELAAVLADPEIGIEETDITFNSINPVTDLLLEESTLKDYTAKIINYFLSKYDNNVVTVAEKLDIGKSTIYRMIKNGEI